MADQYVDRRTVGIPADVELVRDEVERMRDSASASEESASQSADAADKSAAAANLSEETAATLVAAINGMRVGPTEPELHSRTDHMLWIKTTSDLATVSALHVWDAGAAGSALWPGNATYPGSDVYPMIEGTWATAKLAASCLAS